MAHGMTEDEFADLQKSYNIVEAALAEEEVKLTTS